VGFIDVPFLLLPVVSECEHRMFLLLINLVVKVTHNVKIMLQN